jgi:hypothetical protein
MSRARTGALAAVVLAAASIAGAAAGANQPGVTIVDKSKGYAITIPSTWKLVPRSKAQLTSLIAQLKKKKQTKLAAMYSSILSSPSGVSGLTAYRLQAFAYPQDPATPILLEVSLGIVPTPKAYGVKDLPAVGATYANELASNKGSKILMPKQITLPAGPAELIEGSIPVGSGFSNGVELYLIPHGKQLYELAFQVDARLLSQATLFTSMAQKFKFV